MLGHPFGTDTVIYGHAIGTGLFAKPDIAIASLAREGDDGCARVAGFQRAMICAAGATA